MTTKSEPFSPFWVGAFLGVVCFPLAVVYVLALICKEGDKDE